MIALELSCCWPCVTVVSAVGITSADDKVVVGSESANFASTDGFCSKSFRFILVENVDFPHQRIFNFFFFFEALSVVIIFKSGISKKNTNKFQLEPKFQCIYCVVWLMKVLSHLFTKMFSSIT